DTAFRHLDLYDRFGCPAGHIQATFRCLVRQGNIDPKATDTLNSRVHGCWVNPNGETQGTAAVPSGTTNRGSASRDLSFRLTPVFRIDTRTHCRREHNPI